jgi:hypothetical protein
MFLGSNFDAFVNQTVASLISVADGDCCLVHWRDGFAHIDSAIFS